MLELRAKKLGVWLDYQQSRQLGIEWPGPTSKIYRDYKLPGILDGALKDTRISSLFNVLEGPYLLER